MHRHGKAACHLGPQVNAPPAHDLVQVRIRPFNDQRTQLRHLRAGQGARTAGTHLRLQSGNARVVVAATLRWPSIGSADGTFLASYAQSHNVCRSMPFCAAAAPRGQPSRTQASARSRRT